jgi:[ribosomal protein S5]-alanine N-acetyltransferase
VGEKLETARLLLPEWSDFDAALLARLSADPRVVRFIGDGQRWSAEKAAEVSRAMVEHWRANGFGWRVAIERESDELVGFVALNRVGEGTAGLEPDEFEIGWWLLPSVWGRGFASEGARAICQEAFTRVGAPRVVARLQPDNVASARVATHIGMSHEFDTTGRFGELVAVYRLLADDWSEVDGDERGGATAA